MERRTRIHVRVLGLVCKPHCTSVRTSSGGVREELAVRPLRCDTHLREQSASEVQPAATAAVPRRSRPVRSWATSATMCMRAGSRRSAWQRVPCLLPVLVGDDGPKWTRSACVARCRSVETEFLRISCIYFYMCRYTRPLLRSVRARAVFANLDSLEIMSQPGYMYSTTQTRTSRIQVVIKIIAN